MHINIHIYDILHVVHVVNPFVRVMFFCNFTIVYGLFIGESSNHSAPWIKTTINVSSKHSRKMSIVNIGHR